MHQYMTFCRHHWVASIPIECWHGAPAGMQGSKLGPVHRGFTIYVAM